MIALLEKVIHDFEEEIDTLKEQGVRQTHSGLSSQLLCAVLTLEVHLEKNSEIFTDVGRSCVRWLCPRSKDEARNVQYS